MQVSLQKDNGFVDLYPLTPYSAGTSLQITNQSGHSIYLSQDTVAPTSRVMSFPVLPGQTVIAHGGKMHLWISSDGGIVTVQTLTNTISPFIATDLPSDLYTSEKEGIRRLRVDVAQTGFFDGRQFEFIKKFTSPVVYRFTCPVPFILQFQDLTVNAGTVELFAWHSSNVTPSGTWITDPTPIWRLNEFNTSYIGQATIESGGTITVVNQNLYRDYIVIETAGATGQRTSVGTHQADERYHMPGTYYVQLAGAGTGSYHIKWEERPYGM